MKFKITFKRGLEVVAVVEGRKIIDQAVFTAADGEQVVRTEMFLEELTGLRVHIEGA